MGLWRRWRARRSERQRRADERRAKADGGRSPIDGEDYDAAAWSASMGLDRSGQWGGLPPIASRGLIDRLTSGPHRRRR
jgi:hypothetical protein